MIRKEKLNRLDLLEQNDKVKNKPFMCSELAHKLAEDVDQGVLLKLDDHLKLPEVKKMGITKETVHSIVVPSAIHLVANLASSSSPLRLVVAPNCPEATTR